MRFSTNQIGSILNHIAATGVLFEPDEAVEDLEGVLSRYGLSPSLSLRERGALTRALEEIAVAGDPLIGPAAEDEADAYPEGGHDLDADQQLSDLESITRADDNRGNLEALIPPIHPDYMTEDEEQPRDHLGLPREYPMPHPYEPEYETADLGYDSCSP